MQSDVSSKTIRYHKRYQHEIIHQISNRLVDFFHFFVKKRSNNEISQEKPIYLKMEQKYKFKTKKRYKHLKQYFKQFLVRTNSLDI